MTQQVLTAVEAKYVAQSFIAFKYAGNYKGKSYYEHALHIFKETKGQLTDEHLTIIFEMMSDDRHIITAAIASGVLSTKLALTHLSAHNYDEYLCEHALKAYKKDSFYITLINSVKKLYPARYRRLLNTAKTHNVLTASQILEVEYSTRAINSDGGTITADIALSFLETLGIN